MAIARTNDPSKIQPVALSAVNNTGTTFTARWNPIIGCPYYYLDVSTASDFSSFVTGYQALQIYNAPGFDCTYVVTGLTLGQEYYYRIRGKVSDILTLQSNTIHTGTAPAAPVATAATNPTTTDFDANWNSVSGADGYVIDVSEQSNFSSFIYEDEPVASSPFNATGLTPGTTYYYRVRAINFGQPSANSNVISVITICDVPVSLAASDITTDSFEANWETTTGAASYKFDAATDAGFTSFVSGFEDLTVAGTHIPVTGLTTATPYYYRVRAVNASGTSADSAVQNPTTL